MKRDNDAESGRVFFFGGGISPRATRSDTELDALVDNLGRLIVRNHRRVPFGDLAPHLKRSTPLGALHLPARAETVIKSYGISTFGDLKLPADFAYLPYVNPDAPKGGEISEWSPGSFDSFNPYAIAGNAGALSSIFYESILTGTLDDVSAAYCLMCETMEYPEDRSWVIFNLRKDVKFSDGSPLTADDVLFSYELFRDKGIPEFRSVANGKYQSVEVLDPYRIKFTFTPGTSVIALFLPVESRPKVRPRSRARGRGRGRSAEASGGLSAVSVSKNICSLARV